MVERGTLRHPVAGITGAAIAATGLLLIFFYAPTDLVTSLIAPYSSFFIAAYILMGTIAIFGVPIIISYRNDLSWAGWTLMTLLIVSILALLISPVYTLYSWFFIFLIWPAILFLYAIVSSVEVATKHS